MRVKKKRKSWRKSWEKRSKGSKQWKKLRSSENIGLKWKRSANKCVKNQRGNIRSTRRNITHLKHKSNSWKNKTGKLNANILNCFRIISPLKRKLIHSEQSLPPLPDKRKGWLSTPQTKWKSRRRKWKIKFKLMIRTKITKPMKVKIRMKIMRATPKLIGPLKEGKNQWRKRKTTRKLHQKPLQEAIIGFLPYLWNYSNDCNQIKLNLFMIYNISKYQLSSTFYKVWSFCFIMYFLSFISSDPFFLLLLDGIKFLPV